jgi:hypothetical protein
MRPNRFERLTRWGAGALMLLLVHGFCAPRSAWAGCNHLVFSKSEQLLDFNQLDALVAGGSSASVPDDTARDPLGDRESKRRTPCSGPGCSNRVPMPVPTTIPAPDGTDQWGTLSVPVILPPISPPERMTAEPVPDSSRQESSIFHPPRA